VPINYGRRPIQQTHADMDKYSSWGIQDVNLAMQGIFLDESPQVADSHNTTYVKDVRKHLKSQRALSNGLLGKKNLPNSRLALTWRSDEPRYDTRQSDPSIRRPNSRFRRDISDISQPTNVETAFYTSRSHVISMLVAFDTKNSIC
jgi:hypothetical protein